MIDLSDDDHRHLTTLIYAILDAVTGRMVSRGDAMAAFAHVITAAAIGNQTSLRGWLKPETVARWIRRCPTPPQLPPGITSYDPGPDFERRLRELIDAAIAIKPDPAARLKVAWEVTAVLDVYADRTRFRAAALKDETASAVLDEKP